MLEISNLRLYLLTFRNANPSCKFHKYFMNISYLSGIGNRGKKLQIAVFMALNFSDIGRH